MFVYVFLIKRPIDREAWQTAFTNLERAAACPYRASDVYQIQLVEKEPINIPEPKS